MFLSKYIINSITEFILLDKPLLGLNFDGFRCSSYQNRSVTPDSPTNYIDDSFRVFSDVGINCIRIPIHWESYEKNPAEFNDEIDNISDNANRYNIFCIYDNHQWECSSYLGYGIGFPNSLLLPEFHKDNPEKTSLDPPSYEDLENFWNNWWDRKLKTDDGKDGWEKQLEYLEQVVRRVKDKKSTFGFEILNEPQVFRQGDFKLVGNYHGYILER